MVQAQQLKASKEPLFEPLLRQLRLRRVVSQIPAQATLLDVGCGTTAAFLQAIAPQIKQGVGVDFKVEPVEVGNLSTQKMMLGEQLPFEENAFDVVTLLAVLEHIEHEQAILHEIYRVLKPGGMLLLTVPSVWAQPVLEFLAYRLHLVSKAEIADHKRYYNRQRLEQALISGAGFDEFHHEYFQLWMNNFCQVRKSPAG